MQEFTCSMCCYSSKSYERFSAHVVRLHQHDPNFMAFCDVGNCSYSSKSWGAFNAHMSRKHRNVTENLINNEEDGHESDDMTVAVEGEAQRLTVFNRIRHCNAAFALSLESAHNLTHSYVDAVLQSTSSLIEEHASLVKSQICDKLKEQGVATDFLDSISVERLLDEVGSMKKRDTYYEKNLTYIPPSPVKLGERYVTIKGNLEKRNVVGRIVPFLQSLTSLVQMPEVCQYIKNSKPSHTEYMFEICDGDSVKCDPLFSRNPKALQIILTNDDIEMVNPIGSHTKKHKLSMFYYTLANIPPESRSRLQAIQFLGVAKSKDLRKRGPGVFLHDFIKHIKELSSGGIEIALNGVKVTLEGKLVLVPCDTLAGQCLGGFKEGVSFALRCCRSCETTKPDMRLNFREQDFTLRDEKQHREMCDMLTGLSKASKEYWSKQWGINGTSALQSIHTSTFAPLLCMTLCTYSWKVSSLRS